MRLKEIHSSDLTASCQRYVQLRFQKKTRPVATTALFRGLVAGEAARLVHERHLHGNGEPPALYTPLATEAVSIVRKTLDSEGRQLSETVERDIQEITTDMASLMENYVRRFGDRFNRCKLLGCEVPVRWKWEKRMPEFASHIDLLLTDPWGRIVFVDWKLRDTSPTHQYLARNMQFACYWAALMRGEVMLSDGLTTAWQSVKSNALGVWFHLGHVMPFGRKTTVEDDKGMTREFQKGEDRPLRMAWREIEYPDTSVDAVVADLRTRARMIQRDVFPANPDPTGCAICEAEQFCARYDTVL
jgi:hypothetical protein